jgi:GNAT superfamily N-acetyltransferase
MKCLGAKHDGKIIAYSWINLEECHYTGNRFRLKENEAYLFDMYTAKPYRGKNIAPHLRYQIYKSLNEMGRETFFSVSEVFNRPSIKFKKKLKARFLKLCVFIELFKKIRFHITLRRFKT